MSSTNNNIIQAGNNIGQFCNNDRFDWIAKNKYLHIEGNEDVDIYGNFGRNIGQDKEDYIVGNNITDTLGNHSVITLGNYTVDTTGNNLLKTAAINTFNSAKDTNMAAGKVINFTAGPSINASAGVINLN
jgi:hypothetical protein